MLTSNLKKYILSVAVFQFVLFAHAQVPKGQFFSFIRGAANFCQVDGDQASGFNKFGYSLGFHIGQGLGGSWVYETGIAFSVRGSRRPPDPDNPGIAPFNLDYKMIDVPVSLLYYLGKFTVGGGLRTTYTFKAQDKENYILHLDNDTKKWNMLGCAQASWNYSPKMRFTLEYQYSINSIRISNNSNNPFFPTGVYHNVISVGIDYVLSSNFGETK